MPGHMLISLQSLLGAQGTKIPDELSKESGTIKADADLVSAAQGGDVHAFGRY